MKKISLIVTAVVLSLSFAGCSFLGKSTLFGDSGKITINSIPKTYDEFEQLYTQLATTPEGCVALELVAMEMYRVNKSAGTKSLQLVNTETNYSTMMRRLPEIFREGDSYARPYLVASYMQGASPENGYNPNKPYVIRVQRNPAQPTKYYEMLGGTVYPMKVYCYGADLSWRTASVIMMDGEKYYKVQESAGLTVQCKQINRTQTFNGLD